MTPEDDVKTIALFAQKGGAGKTTIAVHLAVAAGLAGEKVVLADTDPQGSATAWAQARNDKRPVVVQARPAQLNDVMTAARHDAMTLMLIDTAPHAAAGASSAAAAADLVLIPVRPSAFDLAAVGAAVEIARTARKAAFVLSACPSRAPEVIEARKALEAYGLPVLDVEVTERRAFARAVASGRAVSEFEPDGRAAIEIEKLWREVRRLIA